MNAYSISLFLHIVGAVGMFVALSLEWTGLWQMRSAMTPQQVGGWLRILKSVRKFGFAAMLTTVVSGVYMMLTVWSSEAWVVVSLGALVLMMALTQMITAPRMMTIGRTLATEKVPLSPTFYHVVNQPLLWISIQTRIAIALGIVLLKVVKPDSSGSLLTIGLAIVLGIISALPMPRRQQAQPGAAK
jgi:hypothetical protein